MLGEGESTSLTIPERLGEPGQRRYKRRLRINDDFS
jgi:hypothetical protein